MGIISKLFGMSKKEHEHTKPTVTVVSKPDQTTKVSSPTLHMRGKPETNGLYPAELVMLAVAEKFKTTQTDFPGYLSYTYEITNPAKLLKSLQSKGYLEIGSTIDALAGLKLQELKDIAATVGVAVKGKKADIISTLSEVTDETLGAHVHDRYWKLTDKGHDALKANPYIEYFLGKHGYNVTEVGVTIWTVSEQFLANPRRPYRDIIFRQIEKQRNEASLSIQKNPGQGTTITQHYCECMRQMSLFVEEEGKSFVNAANLYFQYLFSRINIHAGLQLLSSCRYIGHDRESKTNMLNIFYDNIHLYPFHKTELSRLIDALNMTDAELRKLMVDSFKQSGDTGPMSETDAADFIILELSGDVDRSREISDQAAKKAINRVGF